MDAGRKSFSSEFIILVSMEEIIVAHDDATMIPISTNTLDAVCFLR
jgi:hypothetical protein